MSNHDPLSKVISEIHKSRKEFRDRKASDKVKMDANVNRSKVKKDRLETIPIPAELVDPDIPKDVE